MKKLAIATCALALMSFPVLAQDATDTQDATEHEFPLTMTDFMVSYPDVTPDQFGLIDTDGDGEVSEEEYNTARDGGLIADGA